MRYMTDTNEIDSEIVEGMLAGSLAEKWYAGVCTVALVEEGFKVYGESGRTLDTVPVNLDEEYDEEHIADQINELIEEEYEEL